MAPREKGWRIFTGTAFLLMAVSGCASHHAQTPTEEGGSGRTALTGFVTSRVRIVLPPDTLIRVELVDISRPDAPARTINLKEIWTEGRQFPIPFEIRYGPAAIDPGRTYALQARIMQGPRVLFVNASPQKVITNGVRSNIELFVDPVSGL